MHVQNVSFHNVKPHPVNSYYKLDGSKHESLDEIAFQISCGCLETTGVNRSVECLLGQIQVATSVLQNVSPINFNTGWCKKESFLFFSFR